MLLGIWIDVGTASPLETFQNFPGMIPQTLDHLEFFRERECEKIPMISQASTFVGA